MRKWSIPRPLKVMAVIEVFLVVGWLAIQSPESPVILADPISAASTVMMVTDPEASVTTLTLDTTIQSSSTTEPPPTSGSSVAGSPTTTAPTTIDAGAEQVIAAETDWVRVSAGLSVTVTDSGLVSYARNWAIHMAATGIFGHSDIETLLSEGWEVVGENLAQGSDAPTVTDSLVSSPAHLSVILNPAFTSDGIGVAVDAEGELWVVQIFAGEEILPTTTTVPVTVTTVPLTVPTLPEATIPEPTLPEVTLPTLP